MRDLPIYLGQRRFQGSVTPWLRLRLRKYTLPLQIEHLFLTLSISARLFGQASGIFAYKAVVSGDLRLLQGSCHFDPPRIYFLE
jgi:hypothetical protein